MLPGITQHISIIWFLRAYNAVLNVVPKKDSNSVTFGDACFLQASRETIALQIKLMICQSLSLVSGYDSARYMSLCPMPYGEANEVRTHCGHHAGTRSFQSSLRLCLLANVALQIQPISG